MVLIFTGYYCATSHIKVKIVRLDENCREEIHFEYKDTN